MASSGRVCGKNNVRQGWFTVGNEKTAIAVHHGTRIIERARGKFAVEVASNADVVTTLELIKSAVDAGELDAQLEATASNLRSSFGK